MCNWRASVGAAIFVSVIAAPASAAPIGPRTVTNLDSSVDKARLVCDEFARCWQSQPEPYGPRTSRRYIYNQVYPYSGYGSVARAPTTKWERKGFCPPGQRKKGNC
jgi:hypothetical protein